MSGGRGSSGGEFSMNKFVYLSDDAHIPSRDIIVDPCSGYIYLAATAKGIYRVSMDGDMDTFTQVVEVGPQDSPGALTLDKDSSS